MDCFVGEGLDDWPVFRLRFGLVLLVDMGVGTLVV